MWPNKLIDSLRYPELFQLQQWEAPGMSEIAKMNLKIHAQSSKAVKAN